MSRKFERDYNEGLASSIDKTRASVSSSVTTLRNFTSDSGNIHASMGRRTTTYDLNGRRVFKKGKGQTQ